MAASNKDTKFSGVFFQTERLIVRKWRDPDIEDMILGLNNERTARDFNVPFPYSENDAKAYLQKTKNSNPLIARFHLGEGSGGAARKAMNGNRL